MEIKDFIKSTIKSIAEAIAESQKELDGLGVIVNPERSETGRGGDKFLRANGWRYVQEIDFEITVVVEEDSKQDANAKLKVFSVVDIGGGLSHGSKHTNSGIIKFKLPVALPTSPTPNQYQQL